MATDSKNFKLGLDIGRDAVKMLEVSGHPGNNVISAFAYRDIQGIAKSELANAVKELAGEAKISTRDAAISVSGSSVIVRFISMPNMDKAALDGAIKFEAEKFIPFDIKSCIIDYKILKKEGSASKLSIVLVAAKKDLVQEKIKIANDAGFQVRMVDIDSFAIANAFLKNFPKSEAERTSALINIGGSTTNLCIIRNESVHFARDIGIGCGDFASAVIKKMNVDPKIAGELILAPKENLQEVTDCMRVVFVNLMEETKLSFNYYENQGGRGIDEIYISGGGLGLIGLNDLFQESFGSKPSIWNPLGFLDKSQVAKDKERLDAFQGSFAIAAGLVLR